MKEKDSASNRYSALSPVTSRDKWPPAWLRDEEAQAEALADCEREQLEERAAIMEYDGGLTRAEAERQAWQAFLRCRVNRG